MEEKVSFWTSGNFVVITDGWTAMGEMSKGTENLQNWEPESEVRQELYILQLLIFMPAEIVLKDGAYRVISDAWQV